MLEMMHYYKNYIVIVFTYRYCKKTKKSVFW